MITTTFSFDITASFNLEDLKEYVRRLETNGCDDSQEIHPMTDSDGDIIGFQTYL